MNTYEKITNPNVPSFLCYQPAALRGAPHSVEISDHWRVYGSGIGPTAEKAAIGEFYERRHFYLEVTPDSESKLGRTLSETEQASFINAFQQTALPTVNKKTLDSHVFNMTNVIRTCDFSACSIPTVCISLNDHLLNDDNAVYPMRDTCGCSFHHSLSGAVTGAITESLERQFLTRFWLTNRYANLISNADAHRLIGQTTAAPLLRFLERNAQISLIDISDTRFPGSCILAVYGNADKNAKVKYCAGMCYGADINTAIEKSLLELWQTFRFMAHYLNTKSARQRIEDSYLQHFLSINRYQTYLSIVGFHARDSLDNFPKLTAFNLSTILNQVNEVGHGGYLYIKPTTLNHQTFFYCKFTSPCLFMHMNNSSNINIENSYSTNFISEISSLRKSAMVPFP